MQWRSDVVEGPVQGRGTGPAAWTAASLRRCALAALAAAALPLAGCATKRDLKELRDEMIALQARQDSLFRVMQAQNREVLDAMRGTQDVVLQVRGDLGHQLLQMEQQLVQIQELTGQSQGQLAQLRRQWEARSQQFAAAMSGEEGLPSETSVPAAAGGADVDRLYALGREKLQEGAAATARAAFQQILSQYATHELAPDAQFQIAETYVVEGNTESALREFDRVVELFPNSSRAPLALFRAGMVAKERGNIDRARAYFNRVRSGYPKSDEARQAGEELQRLRGR
jgi:tol-pal system protein YbgF